MFSFMLVLIDFVKLNKIVETCLNFILSILDISTVTIKILKTSPERENVLLHSV